MRPHSANLQQARVMAEYYQESVRGMCLWIGLGVGVLLGVVAERLMHYVPESYWQMYLCVAWIPVYLGGWLANTRLRDRIESRLGRQLQDLEQQNAHASGAPS